jgi:hypothetical protein
MSDRVFFSVMGLAAGLMIALALVWPQGIGARSPGPFGHAPVKQGPAKVRPKGPPPVLTMAPDLSSGPSR